MRFMHSKKRQKEALLLPAWQQL